MTSYFTQYFKNDTWRKNEIYNGQPILHTCGKHLRERGIKPGDVIYPVTIFDGQLFLGGRLIVDRYVTQAEAKAHVPEQRFQDHQEVGQHMIADRRTAVPYKSDRKVPFSTVQALTFITANGSAKLKFSDGANLDRQTLRGIRELTEEAAQVLDEVIAGRRG